MALLLFALLVAFAWGNDFGISADEPENAEAGQLAVDAYTGLEGYSQYMIRGEVLGHHGPSYFMPWQAISRWVTRVLPGWHIADGRHLVNYFVYLLGLLFFFLLAQRFMDREAASMATLFLGTQPLLFGHAFINQKDTPFWVFTVASVVTGMAAVDSALDLPHSREDRSEKPPARGLLWQDWRSARGASKWLGLLLLAAGILAALDILSFQLGFHSAESILRRAHEGQAWPAINQLYRVFAQAADRASVDIYLPKFQYLYWLVRAPLFALLLLLATLGGRIALPRAWRRISARCRIAGLRFIAAGVVLGFTLSIRPIAVFAAALVGLYWLLQGRLRAIWLASLYAVSAGLTTYLTWPYLWDAPYRRGIESLLFTGRIERTTRYLGEVVATDSLPWHYFPTYLATELTEPALPLLLLGAGVGLGLWRKRRELRPGLAVLLAWIAAPLFALIALGMGVYDNLRHLLFALIPLQLVAGLGLQWLMDQLPSPRLRFVLLATLLSPGILGIVRLHPYEYIYFNSFAGGVERAAELHFLDSWCLSYRQAMSFVNADAGPHAIVAPRRQVDAAEPFAREGIEVVKWDPSLMGEADYALTCSFRKGELAGEHGWQRVYVVEKGGAVLSEVYHWSGRSEDE